MIITKEIIEKIKESQEEAIKEISDLESWSIKADEDLKEKWQALIDKLSNIKNSDEINILFLKLFSYLNTGDMIKFVMQLNKKDSEVFYGFIEEIENFKDKEKEELLKKDDAKYFFATEKANGENSQIYFEPTGNYMFIGQKNKKLILFF